MAQAKQNIPFFFFLFTLFVAPLAFGTAEAWSMATVEVLIGATTILFFLQNRKSPAIVVRSPAVLPLGLLIAWMAFQIIPLPPAMVHVIAPATYRIYEPILGVPGGSAWIPLTVSGKTSSLELLRISAYALFYILTVQFLSTGTRLTKTVRYVVFLAIVISFFAIIQKVTSPEKIYWFRQTPAHATATGPYVYHNHYAGFMEMLCPLALALFIYFRPTVSYEKTLRARIATFFAMPSSNLHFFLGFGVILILSSIFISLSRGGMISISLALLLFATLLVRKKTGSGIMLVVLFCFLLLVLSWFDWQPLLGKLHKTFAGQGGINDSRLRLWKDSAAIIHDFFVTGSGFGTFKNIYPQYRTIPGTVIFDHAHNDYIELLTDGGLVGFLLAAWFVLAVLVHGWKNLRQRREKYSILVSIGALTGIVSIMLHSVTDFNMHNGANGLYFFFLCGLLVAAGNTRLHFRTRPTLLKPAGSGEKKLFACLGFLLLFGVTLLYGGEMMAANRYSKVSSIYLNEHLSTKKLQQIRQVVTTASHYDPMEGYFPFILGNVDKYLHDPVDALRQYRRAALLDPLNGGYLQSLGVLLTEISPRQGKVILKIAFERALHMDRLLLSRAESEWLLRSGRRQEAMAVMKKGLEQFPTLISQFTPLAVAYSFSRQEITSILPDSVSAWAHVGQFMEKEGNFVDAEYYRSHALQYVDREKKIKPWFFDQLYRFYLRRKQRKKAIAVLRRGIEKLPKYAPFHIYLGDYYRKEGIEYRAVEEYEQALMLEPDNAILRAKLSRLQEKKHQEEN